MLEAVKQEVGLVDSIESTYLLLLMSSSVFVPLDGVMKLDFCFFMGLACEKILEFPGFAKLGDLYCIIFITIKFYLSN